MREISRAGVALGVFIVATAVVVGVTTNNAPATPGVHKAATPIASSAANRSGLGNMIKGPVAGGASPVGHVRSPVAPSLDRSLGPIASSAAGPYSADQVLVGFKRGTSAARQRSIENGAGGLRARPLGIGVSLGVRRGDVAAVIGRLKRDPGVRYAEPDYVMQASGVPNDPQFGVQWALQNTGQSVGGTAGTAGADEHVVPAWNVTTGSASVVVAVTDTGVDYTHPDLAANMWSNPGGVGGCPAGTHGFDAITPLPTGESLCDPMDTDTVYNGHGTHVAGIIGAVGNNGVGVTGVNWKSSIMAVKWLDSESSGLTSNLIAALQLVIQAKQAGQNIRVVNNSSVFVARVSPFSQALSDEIDQLGANDILFVTAAGNTGQNNDDPLTPRYPCDYRRPNEICVTASDQNDRLPSWANYGATNVDLAAPGNNIYSTLRGGSYGYISGGSMATAEVSGAAALILSAGNRSATALKADILNHVDRLPSLTGLVRTGGRLDVCAALPGCTPPAAPSNLTSPVVSGSALVGQSLSMSNGSWTGSPTRYNYQWERCNTSGNNCVAISGATSQTYTVALADVGATLKAGVAAYNSVGSAMATSAHTTTVPTPASTFGQTNVGGSTDSFAANRKRVNEYALSVPATVSKLTVYLQPTSTSGTQAIEGVIYAPNSTGAPGSLVAVSNPLTFASTDAAGWYNLTFPTPPALAAGNYWIGVITGDSSDVAGFRYSSVSNSRDYNTNAYTSGPSNPFGPVTTIDNEQMSLYATYTPS